jgi:carbon storage regulator CsrA
MWRRSGESFTVGEGVEIDVLDVKTNRVKLGIVAPESIAIIRKEARITREENLAAALSANQEMIEILLRGLPRADRRP